MNPVRANHPSPDLQDLCSAWPSLTFARDAWPMLAYGQDLLPGGIKAPSEVEAKLGLRPV